MEKNYRKEIQQHQSLIYVKEDTNLKQLLIMWVLWVSTPNQSIFNPKNKTKLKRTLKVKKIYRPSKKTNFILSNSYVH
jgi:hypothetical protein